jgi:hypothetical protein
MVGGGRRSVGKRGRRMNIEEERENESESEMSYHFFFFFNMFAQETRRGFKFMILHLQQEWLK